MAIEEKLARNNIVTTPRPDGAVGPTAEEARAANAGELAPRGVQRLLLGVSRHWATRILGGGAAVATGGVYAYENVPAIRQTIEDFRTDALGTTIRLILEKGPAVQERLDNLMGKSVPVSTSFDNKVGKEKIKAGITTIPVEETEIPSLFKNAQEGELLFPVKLSDKDIVNYESDQKSPQVVSEIPTRVELTIPKKGSEIIVPVENAQLYLSEPLAISWTESYFTGIILKWTGKDGKIYVTGFGWGSPDARAVKLMEISKNAPIVQGGKDYWKNIVDSQGLPVSGGMSILVTEFNNAKVGMTVTEVSPDGSQRKLVPFKFMTETGEDGNQKLVYMPTRTIQSHVSTNLP